MVILEQTKLLVTNMYTRKSHVPRKFNPNVEQTPWEPLFNDEVSYDFSTLNSTPMINLLR